MSDQSRVEKWLNQALELENRGHDFYVRAAGAAADPQARDFFQFLAAQELVHIKIIKDIHGRLGDASCWLAADNAKAEGPGLNEIFLKMTKSAPTPQDDLLRAIDGGIVFETEARDFYQRELPQAGCENEKKFLTLLAAEENEHRQALADLKLYYTDPPTWAAQMARGHLDGV